jgi:hypothetical protein
MAEEDEPGKGASPGKKWSVVSGEWSAVRFRAVRTFFD